MKKMKSLVTFFNINNLSKYKIDGHPSLFMEENQGSTLQTFKIVLIGVFLAFPIHGIKFCIFQCNFFACLIFVGKLGTIFFF